MRSSSENEAVARIKINKLLEAAGWRFEDNANGPANIRLEGQVKYTDLGDDFEKAISRNGARGAIDFLLVDKDKRPLVVVEAKREAIEPLSAKEQARKYAQSIKARFIILSNGNIHYLWDTDFGNPETIREFPTPDSITQFEEYKPDPQALVNEKVDENFILASQYPKFALDPDFQDEKKKKAFLKKNNFIQMRPYGVDAVHALQREVSEGNQRFLFEMATGSGKTLISAAVIKLFLRSGNAKRVLFLVDRIELENQAQKAFVNYLGKDYRSVIYKDHADSWANAEVVVSTVQTFLANDRYKKEFSPTDFQLVISDEAHRSIGGNSRAVFEYFVGFKLGLTATPKNYLKGLGKDDIDDQRDYERRLLIDTYKTFGCEPGLPTFSYDLETGAKEGYLIKPTLVDARTEVTAQLLSDEGYSLRTQDESGNEIEQRLFGKDFERKVFNDETNVSMCKALIENGLFDPAAKELGVRLFGKTLVFAVSQKHAARLTNILNKIAFQKWPDVYGQSDFAIQISSEVTDAQQMTINFANNKLSGYVKNPDGYESSKTRIAITVGMMTTGYDCQDLLNVALMRPVFSPTDFVQMKGRGTRKWSFEYNNYSDAEVAIEKDKFKFFDFFASCEYFEKDFPYDEKIKLPEFTKAKEGPKDPNDPPTKTGPIDLDVADPLQSVKIAEGVIMRIDREGFKTKVAPDVASDPILAAMWANGDISAAEAYVKENIFDKPANYLNLERVRKIFNVDRKISVKELLEVIFGEKESFDMKDDLLESEWERFMTIHKVEQDYYQPVKNFFKAFLVDEEVREIVKTKEFARFYHCASFDFSDYELLNGFKDKVPQYIRDYAPGLVGV
jgi:type I restriction enzyme R subunit